MARTIALSVLEMHPWCKKHMLAAEWSHLLFQTRSTYISSNKFMYHVFFSLFFFLLLELQGWGKTIVLGADKPGAQVTLPSYNILHHGKTLSASLFGGIKPKSDIPVLLKRYLDKVRLHLFPFFLLTFR